MTSNLSPFALSDGSVPSNEDISEAMIGHLQDFYMPESDTLGPCGCTDYHMADCDLMSSGRDYYEQDYYHDLDMDFGGHDYY